MFASHRFYKQYKSIQPYLQAEKPADGREHLQSKEDRLKLDGMYEVRPSPSLSLSLPLSCSLSLSLLRCSSSTRVWGDELTHGPRQVQRHAR